MADAELKVRIDAETRELQNGLKKANQDLNSFSSKANNSLSSLSSGASSAMKGAAASIAGAFSIGAVVGFAKEVLNATAEFQKFEAVLGNTLGSSALASLKLKEIQEFAAKTPFGVNELTASFVKLANAGFKPTGDEMTRLGDLASSTGKSFDQLSEAILDAQVGEFERLKEFGVRAQDAGNKVIFTFKGVKTEVDKSSSAIRGYITSLGSAEGVSGSMAVISQTLTGKISNLGDSWDQMLISVGSNTSGVFSGAISILSTAIESITEYNRELEIASKFKIKGNVFETILKYSNKLTAIGGPANSFLNTTQDLKVNAIQAVGKGIDKVVSSTINGAKSADDFGAAIAKLKAEGDKLLKGGAGGDKQVLAAFKSVYEDGIKALQDGRKAFLVEQNKPVDAGFAKTKEPKKEKEFFRAPQFVAKPSQNELDRFLEAYNKTATQLNKTPLVPFPEAQKVKSVERVNEWGVYLNETLLPSLQSGFQNFFDDILKNGTFSFQALGKAILNTFTSILASEATKGVLSLLSGGSSGGDKKSGGLFPALFGAGGLFAKKAAVGTAASTTATVATGTAATGGLLLPILGGLAAGGIIASLFKKKQKAPTPAVSTTTTSSPATSGVDFGGGSVVFQISGANLIGVLNRAGQKLQRYGG
jgi:hypothetical protein